MRRSSNLYLLIAVAALLALVASIAVAQRTVPSSSAMIPDVIASQSDLSDLLSHVRMAGLEGALSTGGPYTVFAPVNSAFARLPKATMNRLMEPRNKAELQSILKYHVVRGSFTMANLKNLKSGSKLRSLEGKDLTITHRGSDTYVDGNRITQSDIRAKNGVIHKIDTVLMPPR